MSGKRELNLDGTEITIIKALGIGGGEISGEDLLKRVADLEIAELIDTLKGLMSTGYVESDKSYFYKKEELMEAKFQVNTGYLKELREALNPKPQKPKSRRVRRE